MPANYFPQYRLEVRAMESGKWYSQLVDADSGMEEWESKEYAEMDDAYTAGKYEWECKCESAREAAQMAKYREKGESNDRANGVPERSFLYVRP